jgi:predicted ATPase
VIVEAEGQWKLQRDMAEVEGGIPEGPQQMILRQLERLSSVDRQVLEAASIAGAEFSVAAIAAGLEVAAKEIEEGCEALARNEQFLRAGGVIEWPDGTVAGRYRFIHALYREVIYERVPAGRRIDLHRKIGEREERAHGDRVKEISAELAVHFEAGRDYRRAARYRQHAGENALRRSAHHEAISHFIQGLELIGNLPAALERSQQELELQLALGPALIATKGNAAPEVEKSYLRAQELCQQLGKMQELFPVLFGLRSMSLARGDLEAAHDFGKQLLNIAHKEHDAGLLLEAHVALGNTYYQLGETALAREHLGEGIALYDPARHHSHAFLYGIDPGVFCSSYMALALELLGYPEQARKVSLEALDLSQNLSHPYSRATALNFAAWFHQLCRAGQATQQMAEAAIALCNEHGFRSSLVLATIRYGWALAEQGQGAEGIAQIRQGLAAWQAMGAKFARPHFLALLAEAYGKVERTEEGLDVLAEALAEVHKSKEHWLEAELHRLKGELTLAHHSPGNLASKDQKTNVKGRSAITSLQAEADAEACFRRAIEIARKQQAKSLELRAVTSLSRLWQSQGKWADARQMLGEIYGWFTEGFDTVDLKDAEALLREVSG